MHFIYTVWVLFIVLLSQFTEFSWRAAAVGALLLIVNVCVYQSMNFCFLHVLDFYKSQHLASWVSVCVCFLAYFCGFLLSCRIKTISDRVCFCFSPLPLPVFFFILLCMPLICLCHVFIHLSVHWQRWISAFPDSNRGGCCYVTCNNLWATGLQSQIALTNHVTCWSSSSFCLSISS